MSHFAVLVTNTDKVGLDTQMEPFGEELEVEAYEEECWCVNSDARDEARKKTQEKLGYGLDQRREEWWALPDEERSKTSWQEWIKEYLDTEEALEKASEFYNKPQADCDECNGTGVRETTYNPDSKWDWYSVGGRWTGFFKLKQGAKGEFHGQSYYLTPEERKADEKLESEGYVDVVKVKDIDWNAMDEAQRTARGDRWDKAQEKPVEQRWQWENNRDELLLMSRDQYVNRPVEHYTFGVLHDGDWYERGKMGWWAMVSDEVPGGEWEKQWKELVASLDPESEVTLVDCHI